MEAWARLRVESFTDETVEDRFVFTPAPFVYNGATRDPCTVPLGRREAAGPR